MSTANDYAHRTFQKQKKERGARLSELGRAEEGEGADEEREGWRG